MRLPVMLRSMTAVSQTVLHGTIGKIGATTSSSPARNVLQQNVPLPFRLEMMGDLDLYEITIDQLQKLFAASRLSIVEYAEFCLKRIQAVGPFVDAI